MAPGHSEGQSEKRQTWAVCEEVDVNGLRRGARGPENLWVLSETHRRACDPEELWVSSETFRRARGPEELWVPSETLRRARGPEEL